MDTKTSTISKYETQYAAVHIGFDLSNECLLLSYKVQRYLTFPYRATPHWVGAVALGRPRIVCGGWEHPPVQRRAVPVDW